MKKIIKHQSKGQTKRHVPSAQPIKENNHHLGMTLYKNRQYLEALLTWWPSIKKQPDDILQKCTEITHNLEQNIDIILKHDKLQSSKSLNTLYLACNHLMPSSSLCIYTQKKLLETWWKEKNFDALEHHLKTNLKKENQTNIHGDIENLGKLAFCQANKKYKSNLPAFVGSVLSGAATLILNTSTYQSELEAILKALGQELHLVIFEHQPRLKQKYVWDTSMLSRWMDYEIGVLTEILKQAIAHPSHAPNIILTPSYFIHSASAQTPLGEKFFTWLKAQNQALASLYDTQVQDALLWVIGGEKLSELTLNLESGSHSSWDPYLQLALALRAEALKPASMHKFFIFDKPIVDKESLQPLKALAIYAAHTVLDTNIAKHDTHQQAILAKLMELIPNTQDPRLQHMKLYTQRQHDCVMLLDQLAENKSKKVITSLKTAEQLREHLTLIADVALLLPHHEGIDLYWHIDKLIKNRRLKSFMPLKNYFTDHGNCCCKTCIELMLKQTIPSMAHDLKLPTVSLKPAPPCDDDASFQSILSQADPFKILGASVYDSKQAIMKKVMACIQQAPENMASFRHAQHTLFDLPQRFLYHYLCHLNIPHTPQAEQVIYEPAVVV